MIRSDRQLNILFLASWYPNKVEPQNGNFIQRHAEAVALNCKVACLHVLSIPDTSGYEVDAQWKNGYLRSSFISKKRLLTFHFVSLTNI